MTLANQTEPLVLRRLLGVAFPGEKEMGEWEREQEEARRRDHRRIGTVRIQEEKAEQEVLCQTCFDILVQDQELFFFNDVSPGSCFFLPKGTHIYNTLTDFIKVSLFREM